jgi:hypothetical protein
MSLSWKPLCHIPLSHNIPPLANPSIHTLDLEHPQVFLKVHPSPSMTLKDTSALVHQVCATDHSLTLAV